MSRKILIIDDEPAVVTYLCALLEDHGYATMSSLSAEEGYNMALEALPDLITLDLLMPEKSGILLYRKLKKDPRISRIPVVIVTGFTADQHPLIDFRKFIYERSIPGPEGFVEKPIDPDVLLSAISDALGKPAATTH